MKTLSKLWHSLVCGCHREHRHRLWRGRARLMFPLMCAAALVWFLCRVIPKPIRATYPCQRAAFPLATSFVIWLIGVNTGLLAWLRLKGQWRRVRPLLTAIVFVLGFGLFAWAATQLAGLPGAAPAVSGPATAAWTPSDPPNSPLGVAKGVFPGRVVWMRDTNVTPWNGSAGNWWQSGNINQGALERMFSRSLRGLTGTDTDAGAWDRVFRYYNQTHGRGDVGYQTNEAIAVKINLNNCYSGYADTDNNIDASPQAVLALLRELVNRAGVPQGKITIYDATPTAGRAIPNRIYDPGHAEFPSVHWVDGQSLNGREAPGWVTGAISYTSSSPTCGTRLPACAVNATYLINFALLKGHEISGITLCGKNHFGSIESPGNDHSKYVNQYAHPMGSYSAFVDFMGCPNLGAKTVLNIIDGLYGDRTNVKDVTSDFCRWTNLFGGQWSASYLMSLDPVAIDSVGLDFLSAEFGNALGYSGSASFPMGSSTNCDNYLHEAARATNAVTGRYRPNGVPLDSLGVHEHWSNAVEKKYSRNLGTNGTGIELVTLHDMPAMTATLLAPTNGTWVWPGTNLLLQAGVTTNLSRLDRVAFYGNGNLIGTCSNAPFNFTWTNAPLGQWALAAVAFDPDGYAVTSAVANVTIAFNQISVALTNPPAGAMFVEGTNVLLQASATALAAPVRQVDFYRGNALIGTSSNRPFSIQMSNAPVGIWLLSAVATDTGNYSVTSAVVNVTVRPAGLVVSGTLHVDLRATDFIAGATVWTNRGTLGHFTKYNTPVFVSDAAGSGIPGVQFNGASDAFVGPNSVADIDAAGSRSFEAWVFNPAVATEETMMDIGHRGTDARNCAFNFGSNLAFGACAQWGAWDVGWNTTGNVPSAGMWHHIVYTYDGATTCLIYVDGVLRVTKSLTSALNTFAGEPILLGAQRGTTANSAPSLFWFSGYLNSVRVHGGVLSATDVAANYAYGPALPSGPAQINGQPQDASALEGSRAVFTVSVTGTAPISYQWHRNGTALPSGTNASFTFTNLAWGDDGSRFQVVASNYWNNTACTVTSSAARLTVIAPGDALRHRYSFTANANDSIGTAHGTLQGAAALSAGRVNLNGTSGTYVNLPGGLIAGYRAVTFEFWASFGVNADWPRVFDQGSTNGNNGQYDLYFCPHSGAGDFRLTIMDPQPTERVVTVAGNLDGRTNLHVACVLDPMTGFMGIYTNGVLAASRNDLVSLGSVATNLFFIGRSLFAGDAWLNGSIDEFRIYDAALMPRHIAQNFTNGPNALLPPAVRIATPPRSRTNYVGTTATFSVVPNACGPVTAQWFRATAPLTGGTNLSLALTNVQFADAADFAVTLANAANSVTSAAVTLVVFPPPSLQAGWSSGDGSLTLSWPVGPDEMVLFETTNLTVPGAWTRATNNIALSNGIWFAPLRILADPGRFYRLQMP